MGDSALRIKGVAGLRTLSDTCTEQGKVKRLLLLKEGLEMPVRIAQLICGGFKHL